MKSLDRAGASDLPSLRLMAGGALGMALANGFGGQDAWAQTAETGPVQLPAVTAEGTQSGGGGYQVTVPDLGKLTQPLVSTPITITEIPRQLLDDEGVTTMRDALRNVPGVSLAAGEGGQQGDNLSIRGFNAQDDFYLDGVRDFGSYYRDPFNLQNVEVLEGPASVLFGRGSTGGAINQVSKQPQIAPVTNATIGLGTDGTYRFMGDFDRPIEGVPGAAFRLNVMGDLSGIAGRDDAENRRFGFAPEIALGLGTPTRVTIDFYHQQSYDTPDYGIPWLNGSPAPVSHDNFYGFKNDDFFRTNVNIATGEIEHDFSDDFSISDQFRYGDYRRDLRVTEPLILNQGPGQDFVKPGTSLTDIVVSRHLINLSSDEDIFDNQTNATLRFNTGPFQHSLVLGVELARQNSNPTRGTYAYTPTSLLSPTQMPFNLSAVPSTATSTVVNNFGVFGVDTISIGKHLDIMGGLRFDEFDSDFKQTYPTYLNLDRDDGLPSYSAAVVYKPVSNASIYFHYGTSFDPSAESLSLSAATAAVAPEKTKTYEVGGKWDVFGGGLSLTGSIYQLQMSNVRETDPNNSTLDILAGNYRVRGFQVGAAGHISERWEFFGGYSYNDGEVVASPNPLELGHQPPNAPRQSLSLFTSYTFPWHEIELGGGMNYISSRTASSTPVKGTNIIETAPGYVTANLMIKYPITKKISVQANVANVTDTYYYDALHPGHIILGPSRSALFTFNVKF